MGLPFALKEAGFLPGLVLLVVVAAMTDYSLRLLARTATAHSVASYQDLVSRAFGTPGFVVAELAQFVFAFGALVAYMLIIKDTAAVVLRDILGLAEAYDARVVLLVASVPILAVCFLGSMAALDRFSALSMLGVVVMVCVVTLERLSASVPTAMSPVQQYVAPHGNVLSAIGSFAFAFVCQHQLLLVVDTMRSPTKGRVSAVVRLSLGTAVALSALMASMGYTLFWEATQGDILRSFEDTPVDLPDGAPSPRSALTVARCCLVVNMTFTYPAELMVCRHVIDTAIIKVWRQRLWQSSDATVFDDGAVERIDAEADRLREGATGWAMHVGLTLALFGCSLGLALGLDDLGVVQELSGSVAAVLLAFVLPAACHLRLGSHAYDTSGPFTWDKGPSVALLVVGIAVFFASTTQTITNIVDGDPPPADDPAVG